MVAVRTPTKITSEVLAFCKKLVADQEPFYVNIIDVGDFDNCHGNVASLMEQGGGDQLCGWSIWQETRGRYLEAIYHSIYVSPKGEQLDVTPDSAGERRRLFLPIHGETYEGITKPSHYMALVDAPAVKEALELFDEASRLSASIRDDERVPDKVKYRVKKLREKGLRLLKS